MSGPANGRPPGRASGWRPLEVLDVALEAEAGLVVERLDLRVVGRPVQELREVDADGPTPSPPAAASSCCRAVMMKLIAERRHRPTK